MDRERIYYLPDEHSPVEVLQTWVDRNPEVLETYSDWSLQIKLGKNHPEEWKGAGREVFGPFDKHENHGDGGQGGNCPLCGEEYDASLPEHLPCDS